MRWRNFCFTIILFTCSNLYAELPADLNSGLQSYNDGQLLEAYSMFKTSVGAGVNPVEASFLLALTKWKMMFLSTYNSTDREEVLSLLNNVDELTYPNMDRDPNARFFYAASLGVRAQVSATDGDWWETAKLGKKMKQQSEFLVRQDPGNYKAYYMLGSYNYFADALPGYIKFLRTFLFVPGGDRTEGSRQLLIAYEKGGIVTGEAGMTLAIIYTFFEKEHQFGLQMCDNILASHPNNLEARWYRGVNLYFKKSWKESQEWFQDLSDRIHQYSHIHPNGRNASEVVPCYSSLDREARYWIARSLLQQGKNEEASKLLTALSHPEVHQPYWLMRGVFLSLAKLEYDNDDPKAAEDLLKKILQWQDVKDSHDKANLMLKKQGKVGTFDIDFL